MAEQTSVRAVTLSESLRQIGNRDVIDLMGARYKYKTVHDARHVTGYTTAAFGRNRMMRVFRDFSTIFGMALQTHFVGIAAKFQRCWIFSSIH